MTKTTNNSFSVKALVAKYRNFVMENTPKSREFDVRVEFAIPYDIADYSSDYQLLATLYKDVLGEKANSQVLEVMSKYLEHFYKGALTNDEYSFLRDNFSEFLDYEFKNTKDWNSGFYSSYERGWACPGSILDDLSVFAVPEKCLQILKDNISLHGNENIFILGDISRNVSSIFSLDNISVPKDNLSEYWAMNIMRYCMSKISVNISNDIPLHNTQDIVVRCEGFGTIFDNSLSIQETYNLLKSKGKMYLDIPRDSLKRGSNIYSFINDLVQKKEVASIMSYKYDSGLTSEYRCLVIIDKQSSDEILFKAEIAKDSVVVSYEDIDRNILWPGYYYNKHQENTIPLSNLVDLDEGKTLSPIEMTHFILRKSLEKEFLDSALSESDLFMAEKAMKRMRLERFDEAKSDGFKYSDEDLKKWETNYMDMIRKGFPGEKKTDKVSKSMTYFCDVPCVVFNSSLNVGYVTNVPNDGLNVSRMLYCLKPKNGITPQYIAALLCDKDIKLQILRTCEGSLSFGDIKYILDKIYVPNHTPIERERYVTSVVMSAYNNLRKEKEQDLTNYSNGIRLRKHALSQSLSSVSSLFDTLNTLRKRNFGTLDDTDVVSVKGFTVADIFERLEKWLPEVMETVDHLADIDYSFGKIESINPETFIEGYISSHDNEWMNFSASVNWIRGNNIAREDIKMNGNVIIKKGNPINILYFPKDALYRILDNIVSNAKEYAFTDKGREDYDLHFSWRMNGTDLVIEIANNGTPIPEDRDVRSLLEYGVSSNLHSRGHNGIGCHEIKGIMNRYNGDFEIVSKPQDKYTVRYLLVFKSTNTLYTL